MNLSGFSVFIGSCGWVLYRLPREGEGKLAGTGKSTAFARQGEALPAPGLCFFHRHM